MHCAAADAGQGLRGAAAPLTPGLARCGGLLRASGMHGATRQMAPLWATLAIVSTLMVKVHGECQGLRLSGFDNSFHSRTAVLDQTIDGFYTPGYVATHRNGSLCRLVFHPLGRLSFLQG